MCHASWLKRLYTLLVAAAGANHMRSAACIGIAIANPQGKLRCTAIEDGLRCAKNAVWITACSRFWTTISSAVRRHLQLQLATAGDAAQLQLATHSHDAKTLANTTQQKTAVKQRAVDGYARAARDWSTRPAFHLARPCTLSAQQPRLFIGCDTSTRITAVRVSLFATENKGVSKQTAHTSPSNRPTQLES